MMKVMNGEGKHCQLRTDNSAHNLGAVHYCGQLVGQQGYYRPCGRCSGRCGPKNGCQCWSCHALDAEIESRKRKMARAINWPSPVSSFVNIEGADSHVSYCPPSINGHYIAGYKFYCNRKVGRAGYAFYHPNCTCDGRCGPDNGCQCRACYRLDRVVTMAETVEESATAAVIPFSCVNLDNSVCHLSMDDYHQFRNVHYCGRFVGPYGYHNGCGRCDGQCGPNNGCQCKVCHELDEEITIRQRKTSELLGLEKLLPAFFNEDGVKCEVSYCPPAANGHFSAGYKFYCCRRIGGEGHFPAHPNCDCDGFCGPDHGCQCRACYESDQVLARVEIVEESAAASYTNRDCSVCRLSMDDGHQFRNAHYCGRKVGQQGYYNPCGQCDGRCGPGNGCQCKACHELDEEIASRKRVLALTEDVTPFVNGDGVECQVSHCPTARNGHYSAGYKFYCSRMVGREGYFPSHSNCTCDGRCGPNNGCQCRACFELDQMIIRRSLAVEPTPEPNLVAPPPASEEESSPSLASTVPSADDLLCIVCYEAPKCIAVVPCGHVSMCQRCFGKLNSMPNKKCPLCKGNIQSHIKVFL